jgi:hypothetical protein
MWPDANIGIATGARSGVFVLDVDTHGEDGMATLAALEAAHGDLPQTVTSATGGGGLHYYFKLPPDGRRIGDRTKFAPGLDVCAGRLVVAAPSLHGSGNAYAWLDGLGPDDVEPAEAPAWLRDLIAGRPDRAPAAPGQASPSSPYGNGALNRAVGEVFNAPEGRRNDVLNRQAFSIGQIMAAEAIDYDVAEQALVRAGIANGLTEQEAAATARSGLEDGMASPRQPKAEAGRAIRLLTPEDLRALPPLEWLIEGVLTKRGLSVVFGPSGAGKTFLVIDLALSIAMGASYDGRATHHGSVIYVAAEGLAGMQRRLDAWQLSRGLPSLHGIWIHDEPLNLMDERGLPAFIAAVRETAPAPALIILDTLALCIPGGDENSARDMGLAIAAAKRLQRELQAAVMLVHHTGKGGETERGSGALRGAADTMIAVRPEGATVRVECSKQKDAEPFSPSSWVLTPWAQSCVLQRSLPDLSAAKESQPTEERAKKPWQPNPNQRLVLEVIKQAGSGGITMEAAKKQAFERYEMPRSTTDGCVDALEREGLVALDLSSGRYRSAEVSVSGLDGVLKNPRPTPTTRQTCVGPVGIEEPDTPTQAPDLELMPVGSALVGLCKNDQPDNACRDSIPTPNPTNPKANSDGHSAA